MIDEQERTNPEEEDNTEIKNNSDNQEIEESLEESLEERLEERLEESLEERLEEALREKNQFRQLAQRAQADFINYKRRSSLEQDNLKRTASSNLILKILAFADDLERAIDSIPNDTNVSIWLEGLQIVRRNLNNVLQSEGVTRIEPEGQSFEPHEHEAIFFEETADKPEGTVIKVIRNGYKLHEKILRAAQVTIAKKPEQNNKDE